MKSFLLACIAAGIFAVVAVVVLNTVQEPVQRAIATSGFEKQASQSLDEPRGHSMTSSAIASNFGGISSRSALAVLRLITSSNFVDCMTGRSAAFSPLRILPA